MQARLDPFNAKPATYLFLTLFCCLRLWGLPQATPIVGLPSLTTVKQIRELSRSDAVKNYPVRLRVVVTYYWGGTPPDLFLHDSTGGVWVNLPEGAPPLHPGDVIEIEGVSEQPDFAPQIGQPRWRVVGTDNLPAAPRVSYSQMASTHEDGQWVEVQGIVRTAGIDPQSKNLFLDIGMEGGLITAQIPDFDLGVAQRLIDSEILIRGNCGAIRNALNQQIGLMLYGPSLAEVHVIGPAPSEPFSLPVRPLADLQGFALDQPSGHRVHVRGVVTLHVADGTTYLSDPTGGFSIQSNQQTPLKPGDQLDVLGFLGVVDRHPVLEDAVFKVTGAGRAPQPVGISAAQALQGQFDSVRVKMQGRLVQIALTPDEKVLVLRQGTALFTAASKATFPEGALESLREGTLLQVTGVCVVDNDASGNPQSFKIRFDAPDGIVILQRPSWWTLQLALEALGITLLVVVAAAAWVLVLKRRVKRQTNSLEERTAYLNALVERSPVAIVVVDSNTRVQMCNPAFEGLFQYRREEIVGAELNPLIAPGELLHEASQVSTQVEKEGQHVQMTTRRRRKDGTLVDVELYGVPLKVAGKVVGVYGLYLDITARKKAESELQKAKEVAEAANRAKSEFLANMSHEIRTPMNGVLVATELALDTDLNPEQREYMGMAKTSAETLLCILDDILDYSKIEAGRLDLDPIPFRLRECLALTVKPLALRAQHKNLKFICNVHPDVPEEIIADPTRLQQVIINLIGNAIKFTERGEVGFEVAANAPDYDQIQLHFVVRDTGIGIPAEKKNLIFEAFSQADGSTARRFGGTGLGLTISSRLVEMMEGQIWVESAPGQGSRFHFTARARLANVPALHQPAPEAGSEALHAAHAVREGQRKLRILLAEDNPINQVLAARLIEKQGNIVTVVNNGREALEALEKSSFDMVLMDVQMPELDGFEATAEIRTRETITGRHVPIIAMTAYSMKGDRERCLAAGMDSYVSKPIRPEELFREIYTFAQPLGPARASIVPAHGPSSGLPVDASVTESK
jgi:PAS domain S-box-containing protein